MHVLIDLDGTLTYPREGITTCIQHALRSLGQSVPPKADLERYIGPPLQASLLELLGSESLAREALALYRERFGRTGLYENEIYPGIRECLDRISTEVDSMCVVTSKPTVYATRIVAHFKLDSYFRVVYGSELDGTRTDKVDLLAHVLDAEGLDPGDAIMIGDRRHDIDGARAHGVFSIGVLWGYGDRRELSDAGADALCDQPGALAAMVLGSGVG